MKGLEELEKNDVSNYAEAFKLKVDLIAQTILIAIAAITLVYQGLGIIFFYFGIGAYQLMSSFLHLQYKNHSLGRKAYWPQLIIHAATFLYAGLANNSIDVMVVILFTTGFSAFYYYFLTLIEYVNIKK